MKYFCILIFIYFSDYSDYINWQQQILCKGGFFFFFFFSFLLLIVWNNILKEHSSTLLFLSFSFPFKVFFWKCWILQHCARLHTHLQSLLIPLSSNSLFLIVHLQSLRIFLKDSTPFDKTFKVIKKKTVNSDFLKLIFALELQDPC